MICIPRSLNTFSQRNDPWIKTTGLSQVGPSFQNEGGTTSVPFTSVYVARSFAELGGVQIGLIKKVASYVCYAHDSWYSCLFRSWLQPAWMNANAYDMYIYIYLSHQHQKVLATRPMNITAGAVFCWFWIPWQNVCTPTLPVIALRGATMSLATSNQSWTWDCMWCSHQAWRWELFCVSQVCVRLYQSNHVSIFVI